MKKLLTLLILFTTALIIGHTTTATRAQTAEPTAEPTAVGTPADPLGGATTFAKADKPTTVNIILDWTPNTNHLGLYVAQAKDYYKEANLTVEIQPAGDVQAEQVVASNKAQFGISYEEQATYSRAQDVPIVSVAAIIQHNTSGFATLHDKKPISRPSDLAGLRYGAFGSAVEKPMLDILLKCDGGTKSVDDINFVDIGFVDALPLMERDRIDFVWLFYAWDGIRAKQQHLPLDFIMLKDYTQCVPDYYTPLLITNEEMIKNQPDVVRAFVQATARGYADAIKNPGEAADILLKAAPDLDANLVKESAQWLADQFQAEAPRWGEQKAEVWQGFTDFLVKNKALEKPIEVDKAFTNEFLPGQ